VELVRVHHQGLFAGFGQIVAGRQRQPLPEDVVGGQAHPRVVRSEPAERLGEPLGAQQLVPEQPVADVVRVVEAARGVVEPVHPDVVQQAAGPHQAGVDVEAGRGLQLLGDAAHDLAVRPHEVERLRRRRVLLVQGEDFLVRRNPHATGA